MSVWFVLCPTDRRSIIISTFHSVLTREVSALGGGESLPVRRPKRFYQVGTSQVQEWSSVVWKATRRWRGDSSSVTSARMRELGYKVPSSSSSCSSSNIDTSNNMIRRSSSVGTSLVDGDDGDSKQLWNRIGARSILPRNEKGHFFFVPIHAWLSALLDDDDIPCESLWWLWGLMMIMCLLSFSSSSFTYHHRHGHSSRPRTVFDWITNIIVVWDWGERVNWSAEDITQKNEPPNRSERRAGNWRTGSLHFSDIFHALVLVLHHRLK